MDDKVLLIRSRGIEIIPEYSLGETILFTIMFILMVVIFYKFIQENLK